jgi:hypothetical protein
MSRVVAMGVLVLASVLSASPARAEEPALLGLFEGHGIAPPSDPARARAAIAAAQRVQNLCASLYQARGGGTATSFTSCSPRKVSLASLGRDAAAAILDVLDEPRREGSMGLDSFADLLHALAATGREDVVPVLITALERMEARTRLSDARVSHLGWNDLGAMNTALTRLTYLETYEQSWSTGSSNDTIPPVLAGWRAFWEQNKGKTRATWKAESIERARRKIAAAKGEDGIEPAIALAQHDETRREGIAALKRLVRSEACSAGCWGGRTFLARIEPRGRWLPQP